MVRLPGEPGGDQTTRLGAATSPGGAGPRPGPPPEGAPAGPTVVCPTCGASNPADRTLCQRCAAGLSLAGPPVDDRPPWWRRRVGWLLLAVVLGAAVTTLWWSRLDRGGVADGAPPPAQPSAPASAAAAEPAPAEVLLEPGDRGEDVTRWQELLQDAGIDLQADGQFGPRTEAATRRFQATLGEEPSGQVTTRTMAAAERASSFDVLDVHFVRDGALDPVRRRVDRTELARGVLRALLAGPLQAERDDGLSSAIPADTALQHLEVDGGVAVVELTGFAAAPDDGLDHRVDQVVSTLTQFASIEAVRFVLPPQDAQVFADANVVVDEPVGGRDG